MKIIHKLIERYLSKRGYSVTKTEILNRTGAELINMITLADQLRQGQPVCDAHKQIDKAGRAFDEYLVN